MIPMIVVSTETIDFALKRGCEYKLCSIWLYNFYVLSIVYENADFFGSPKNEAAALNRWIKFRVELAIPS